MEKKTAIELAQKAAEFIPAEKYFVTDDEKVFTEAEKAVSHAMGISAGNPQVTEVLASEFVKVKAPAVELTKAQKVEAAKAKVVKLEGVIAEKTTALETVDSKKKGAATVALNKVKEALETAQKQLADAEALTEE